MSVPTFSTSKAATLTGLPQKAIREILATLPVDPGVEQIVAAFVTAVRKEQTPASPRAFGESATDSDEPKMPRGIYSISALHEMFLLDRATVTKRLRTAQVKPAFEKQKFKGFRLTDKGKGGKTVEQILEAGDDPRLLEVKIRNELAAARNKELDYEERSGVIRAEIMREVRDELTKIFKALYTRMVKRYWRENSRRLRRCKSDVDLQRTGETDQALLFSELKRDYPELFERE
jgi:hypothetical protein